MSGPGFRATTLLALAAVALGAAAAGALDVPYLAGRVNDYANMLDDAARQRLEGKLAELEAATGAQVAILTIETLGDEPIEDYSMRVAETWKLGQKGKDNGVLVLVARGDRKMRIEVGYGLEAKLTDALCSRIITDVMRPRFRAGQFGEGLDAAADAISGIIQGKEALPAETPAQPAQELPLPGKLLFAAIFTIVVGLFSLIAIFSTGCQSWFLYVFLMPFYLAFPIAFAGPPVGVAMFAGWVIGCPILKIFFAKSPAGKAWLKRHPGWAKIATSSGRGGSSGWSSRSSGGGFSGGGGSFGGGGSSGSW